MQTYQFFIGSNNVTKQVELEKIKTVLKEFNVDGYTIFNGLGSWQGETEDMVMLTIGDLARGKALEIAETLKTRLNQFSIGLQRLPKFEFVS